jgi:hypothetical protein
MPFAFNKSGPLCWPLNLRVFITFSSANEMPILALPWRPLQIKGEKLLAEENAQMDKSWRSWTDMGSRAVTADSGQKGETQMGPHCSSLWCGNALCSRRRYKEALFLCLVQTFSFIPHANSINPPPFCWTKLLVAIGIWIPAGGLIERAESFWNKIYEVDGFVLNGNDRFPHGAE